MKNIIYLACVLPFVACSNYIKPKGKEEPQQVESDSATAVVSDHPITDMLYAELDSADVYDDAVIQGYWFKPHEACYVNVFFHKDNTFEYKFYTVDQDDETTDQFKKGTYTIDGDKIHLGLLSLAIPDSVSFIGKEAFVNCSGLTSVTSI